MCYNKHCMDCKESISLGTAAFISSFRTHKRLWRIKSLFVTSTTCRVGRGMANGRTNCHCSYVNCITANSGIKVIPFPLSTIRIKVSILPKR